MRKSIEAEPDRLLLTTANVIAESVANMQQAVNRISDLAMPRDRPMPEMVVAFQAFDRLTQEFGALGEMLRAYAHAPYSENAAEQVVQAIPLSELKRKLMAATCAGIEADDLLEIGTGAIESERVF
jgi:hypothetical protein